VSIRVYAQLPQPRGQSFGTLGLFFGESGFLVGDSLGPEDCGRAFSFARIRTTLKVKVAAPLSNDRRESLENWTSLSRTVTVP